MELNETLKNYGFSERQLELLKEQTISGDSYWVKAYQFVDSVPILLIVFPFCLLLALSRRNGYLRFRKNSRKLANTDVPSIRGLLSGIIL